MNASIFLAPNFRIRCRRNEKISTGAAVGRSKLETLFMNTFAPFRKKGPGSTCPFSMLVEQEKEREEGPREGSRRAI